jgi:hypothetical protein
MGTRGLLHDQAVTGGPWEQVAQIVAVSVEGPAAGGGQERHRGQLGLVGYERVERRIQFRREVEGCHLWSSFVGGGSRQHPKGQARLVESELTK